MTRKKIYGYCRISTEEQKKGFGIDIQVREIRAFARNNGIRIDKVFKDEAVSGTKESRTELNRLKALCEQGNVRAVIFPSTDRVARTVRISENLYYELSKDNVRIYFADMPYYDPGDFNQVMMRQIREVIAEGNRNAIVKKLKDGRMERTRKGKPAGGNTPYGYRRVNKRFEINPPEAETVKQIFKLKEEQGAVDRVIAEILNWRGLTRRNGKDWTQRQVNAIINRMELWKFYRDELNRLPVRHEEWHY